jgi:hypothetical protein
MTAYVRCAQVYAARQGAPLEPEQLSKAKEVVAGVASAFSEERIQSMAQSIKALL